MNTAAEDALVPVRVVIEGAKRQGNDRLIGFAPPTKPEFAQAI